MHNLRSTLAKITPVFTEKFLMIMFAVRSFIIFVQGDIFLYDALILFVLFWQ